jgi:hypothetical protein
MEHVMAWVPIVGHVTQVLAKGKIGLMWIPHKPYFSHANTFPMSLDFQNELHREIIYIFKPYINLLWYIHKNNFNTMIKQH